MYDLLILGGEVLDGTGSPAVRADVAISGDRIAAIGDLSGARARDTLDAAGRVVAPGFVDALGHSEYRLLEDGRATSKVTQGITSEVTGEVSSVVPVNERTLEELEERWRPYVAWDDLDGYFAELERRGTAINLATFVTAGSVRRAVMGDVDRPATPEELARMREMVDEAMRQGAVGLSSGLAYAPASFMAEDELVALAEVAARYGGGYASHVRSEGSRLVESVEEAIRIGERAGAWVQVHHLKASGRANWGKVDAAIAAIEAARERGVDVTADQYPYAASGTDLAAILPGWAHEGGRDAMLARLRDPAARARLRAELVGPGGDESGIGASAGGPPGVLVSYVVADSLRRYQGMRLSEVAEARGQPAVEALFDLLVGDELRPAAVYFAMSEEDVETVMREPWVMVGGDAGARPADSTMTELPHPRAYGTFPRILCRYVRERGVVPLPEMVRRMTSLPARRHDLADRGVLRAGAFADVTVFDPETVCDRATYVDPVQTAVGIEHVVVNGVPVLRGGEPTGARPGRGLRRGR